MTTTTTTTTYAATEVGSDVTHPPTQECGDLHCYAHDVDEPAQGEFYCGECHHTFVTGEDLVRDHNAVVDQINALGPRSFGLLETHLPLSHETDPLEITVCPHCSHDL